jgi:hypothetical protein
MKVKPMSQVPKLRDAIEQLYHVFSSYRLVEYIDGCPYCVFDQDHVSIHSAPLRVLSAKDLEKYAFKAMSTWGNSQDYRHFLPRLLELQAQSTSKPTYVETAFGKLRYAEWHTWSNKEQEAIRTYFLALWLDVLDTRSVGQDPLNTEASSYLCAFSRAGEDLKPYLTVWAESNLTFKRDHFVAMVHWFGETIRGNGPLKGGFWEAGSSNQVRHWLAREETWRAFGLKSPHRDQSAPRSGAG